MSYVILFAGGTASGKTTIANEIIHHLDALVLTHDRYYKDIEIQEGHNFDEPEALDNDRIIEDIKSLKERRPPKRGAARHLSPPWAAGASPLQPSLARLFWTGTTTEAARRKRRHTGRDTQLE